MDGVAPNTMQAEYLTQASHEATFLVDHLSDAIKRTDPVSEIAMRLLLTQAVQVRDGLSALLQAQEEREIQESKP